MASQSVLELAVNTGKWDSGLKKAKTALDNFTTASGGLQQALGKDADKMQKFVQMMGSMDSKAKTAKGQMNDYKSTIEQLTMQYNRMTDAQQKTIGQDYLRAIDQLRQKYQAVNQEVQQMNRNLQNMPSTPKGDGFLSGLGGKMEGALAVFGGNLMTKAAGAVAQLGSEMADMVKQGVELAKQGEGIRIAFERLGRGDILQGLREATHGTVTDIELMKAAVKFNDFKLPVEELGTMLAFAQQKAKDTGQSVDYMVDSIVTGLGRKSLMILDNLGLSATEVKEKMKETGDMTKAVGEIIREQMAKAGDYVETAADRAAQANVSLQNKMEELGRKFAPLEEASNSLWTSMKIGILDIIGGPLTDLLNKLTQAGRMANAYGLMGGNNKVGRMTANLASASEGNRQSIYQQQQENFWRYINPREQMIKDIRAWQSGERGDALSSRVGAIRDKYGMLDATKIQAEVDAAKKMLSDYQQAAKQILNPVKADIDTKGAEQNVESLKVKLIELEAQRKNAIMAGDQDLAKDLTKQINQTKSLIKALDPNALKKTKAELTELQKNQQTINTLTQEYVRLCNESTEAARKRQEEIQKEISRLQKLNGLLALRTEQAQGRLLPVDMSQTTGLARDGLLGNPFASDNAAKSLKLQLDDKAMSAVTKQIDKQLEKYQESHKEVKLTDALGQMSGGIGSIASGLQQMGIELPEGLQEVIGVVQGLMDVIQGVQTILEVFGTSSMTANTAMLSGNTAALGALTGVVAANTAAVTANTVTPSLFAGGGIVHAAGGFRVPGHSFSGDRVPALLNSGELVLNTGQQEIVAQALMNNNGGGRTYSGNDYVSGQNVFIGTNNYLRGSGQGQLVTTRMLRQYGLIH